MFDNIFTSYRDAKIIINEVNARQVIEELSAEILNGGSCAEKYAYLSKAYVFAHDNENALKYAKLAVEADNNYAYGYIRLAFAYARLGDKNKCLYVTNMACSKIASDNNFLISFLVILYNFCDEERKAERLMNLLLKNYSNTADYFYYIGFVYSQESPLDAIEYFKKAESLNYRDSYSLWLNLAENYYLADDYENSEFYSDKCLSIAESSNVLKFKAECLKENERYDEAVSCLRRKYKFDKTEEDKLTTLVLLIYNLSYSSSPKKTEKYLNFAFKNFKPTSTLYYVAGSYFENADMFEEAVNIYQKMLLMPEVEVEAPAYTSISYCYSQLGDIDKALMYADKALELEPDDYYAYYRKGRIYVKKCEYEKAIDCFLLSVEYNKTDVDSFQWISYCYSMIKDYDKSLEYANRAILLDKNDCYSYFRKAWAYQENQRYDEAINFYKECIRCNDRYVDAYLNISYIYSKLKDTKQSLKYANEALLINKDYAYAHYRKAWALQESGRLEEAYDGYSKAIELDPTDIYNYLGIASISLNQQENSNALLFANKAIFLDKNCGGAYYYKSLALENMGKTQEAETAYTKAIQLGYVP